MHIEKKNETILYSAATFLLTAVCWLPLVLLGLPVKETGSVLANIMYILGGLSPTIVALFMPLFAGKGKRSAFYKRYFKFTVSLRWYIIPVALVLLMVLLPYGASLVFYKQAALSLDIQPLYMLFPLLAFMLVFGGGLEELGWRGILVHNLKKNNAAMIAAGVGLVWLCWHLPLFFIKGTSQYQTSVIPFLLFVIACSFATTILYLKSGSAVPCVLFHALLNTFGDMGFRFGNDQLAASVTDNVIKLVIAVMVFVLLNSKVFQKHDSKVSCSG